MIQIYSSTNTNYEQNGDSVLLPINCLITASINQSWTIEITHPIDNEGRWKYIEEEAVVKAPSFNGDQLFRLKTVTKTDTQITATGEPIFMDAMDDCFLVDVRPTEKNGQQALDIMTAPNSKYTGQSNITKLSTAYYQFKNLIEAINGDDENSFINRWGGEIFFDNFKIIINETIGTDAGVEIRYGKNIPLDGFSQEVDTSAVVTRIYPKAFNGYTMTNSGYVDSDLINNYPTVKAATITFDDVKMAEDAQEDDAANGIIICNNQTELDAALTQKCNEQFSAGVDKPKVTINCQMIQLANTEQYKDYAILETVSLGDTVHCVNNHLGIKTDARVISLTYDSILKKVDSVTIGDYEYNYFNNVTSTVNRVESAIRPDGTVMAEQISGFINGAFAQLRLQNSIAQKQNVRAILFEDLDPDSSTFGAMSIGTQGLQISRQRNPNNNDWIWTTAMTAEGLIANIIVAGLIADKTGKSYWNLDTGQFVIDEGTITAGTINGAKITSPSDTISGDIIIEDGMIKSNRTVSGVERTMQIYNGGIQFLMDWASQNIDTSALLSYGGLTLTRNDSSGESTTALSPGSININSLSVLPMQTGEFSVSVPAEAYGNYNVTFPTDFKNTPIVLTALKSAADDPGVGNTAVSAHSITGSGCEIRFFNNGSSTRTTTVVWAAFGI